MDPRAGMDVALAQARLAAERGEVPIGAVIFGPDDQLVSAGGNTCTADGSPLQHAELVVLTRAHQLLSQTKFRGSTLYVTLEPCPMCMGAILHSHLGRLVFGAYNLKWGCCGTVSDFSTLFPAEAIEILGGIREAECASALASFFAGLR